MNVLFIYSTSDYSNTNKPLLYQERMQFGISYISSFIKSKGHNISLLVLARSGNNDIIDTYIDDFNPELICFTAVTGEYEYIAEIAKYIKLKYTSIYLLIGGVHVSLNPDEAIKYPFDAICISEGEYATLELIQQLDNGLSPSGINNLWIKKGNDIEKNQTRTLIHDLDILPFPDREIWQRWINYPDSRHVILLGRGCPYQCTYCCNHALRRLASGKYARLRSVKNVINELTEVILHYPNTNEIYFEVESIGIDKEYTEELCLALEAFNKRNCKLKYGVNLRLFPGLDCSNFFSLFKRANIECVNIGLESGSQRVREEILKREYSNLDFINTVNLAKKYELKVNVLTMIGFPGETIREYEETIYCLRSCQPHSTSLSIFFPYPGTDLHSYCKENGLLLDGIDVKMERRMVAIKSLGFHKKEIEKEYIWFPYNVYKGYRPIYSVLGQVLLRKVQSNYYLNFVYRKMHSNHVVRWVLKRCSFMHL